MLLAALPTAPAGPAALLAVPPLVFGMLLVAVGAADAADDGDAPAEPVAAAWPRAVLPAAVLLLAAGLHLAAGRAPDRTSVLSALAAVPSLVLRELLRAGGALHRPYGGPRIRRRAPGGRGPAPPCGAGALAGQRRSRRRDADQHAPAAPVDAGHRDAVPARPGRPIDGAGLVGVSTGRPVPAGGGGPG